MQKWLHFPVLWHLCFTHVHQVLLVDCDHRLWFGFFPLAFEWKFMGCSLFYVQKHALYSCAGFDFLFNIFCLLTFRSSVQSYKALCVYSMLIVMMSIFCRFFIPLTQNVHCFLLVMQIIKWEHDPGYSLLTNRFYQPLFGLQVFVVDFPWIPFCRLSLETECKLS